MIFNGLFVPYLVVVKIIIVHFPWPVSYFHFCFAAEVNNPDLAQHSFIMSIKTEPNVSVY